MATHAEIPRSPLENVINFLPQGHEKALKHAFYNAAGMIFVVFCALAVGAVYFVLQPFLRPLLWAVLFGSVLHPFKRSLTDMVRKWLRSLKISRTPLTVGIILLPVGVIEHSSQTLGNTVQRYKTSFAVVTIGSAAIYLICTFTPQSFLKLLLFLKEALVDHTHDFFGYFSAIWVWTLVAGFFLIVIFYWSVNTSRILCTASILVWTIMFLHFASVLGSYRAPVFIVVLTLMVFGFLMEVNDVRTRYRILAAEDENARIPSPIEMAWSVLTGAELPELSNLTGFRNKIVVDAIRTTKGHYGLIPNTDQERSRSPSPSSSSLILPKYFPWADQKFIPSRAHAEDGSNNGDESKESPIPTSSNLSKPRTLNRQPSVNSSFRSTTVDPNMSNIYIYGLIWACLLVQLWKHVWVWPLLAIPLVYLIIKRSGTHFGLWAFLMNKFWSLCASVGQILGERKDAFIPSPIRGIGKLIFRGEEKFLTIIEQSVDTLTSISSILILLVFVIMATIYLLVQIHAESMHLVQVTSNLINTTVVHNPDIQGMLPEGVSNMIDSMFDNAYEYGREWAVKMVKNIMNEQDETKAAQIEKQVVELWDKVYQTWMESSQTANAKILNGENGMFNNIMAEMELFNFTALVGFVKENVDTFMAVIEASWTVLKGNISLALSALTATLSLLFGGGTALLNFLLSSIVFLTALFYLLSASGELYKPIALFNKLTPAGSGTQFGKAVEEAITDVFKASFKMAFFYGLWTWLIHTLFKVKMVYIPSALAAIFGAMPFLGTFWAAIPAVLELWLVNGQGVKAIVMLICQILPMSCVDTAIYSEIKGGGHPYLTGLAVAGGIFCLGAEGAIIGPLLLCSLFVAMNMYDNVMQESPVNDPSRRVGIKSLMFKRRQCYVEYWT